MGVSTPAKRIGRRGRSSGARSVFNDAKSLATTLTLSSRATGTKRVSQNEESMSQPSTAESESELRFSPSLPLIYTATRVHRRNADQATNDRDIEMLKNFVINAQAYSTWVGVAVDGANDALVNGVRKAMQDLEGSVSVEIEVLVVPQWGHFVPALNTLVQSAAMHGADQILFASVEVQCREFTIHDLVEVMDEDTLVVGSAFPDKGHRHREGEHELDGLTAPWNTCALWNMRKLSLTGFLPVSEGYYYTGPKTVAGVEEVAVIATQQSLLGAENAKAKLMRINDGRVTWKTNWHDESRKKWHIYKMKSKLDRPRGQLKLLGSISGVVHHVVPSNLRGSESSDTLM
eukprot:Clim_evm131s149 gene=Clim_evmTU131s149